MRKLFTSFAVCLGLLSASAQESYTVKTLTFEDSDYVSDSTNYLGKKNWSSLIDSPQYGGNLLYGENHGDTTKVYSDVNYRWYDRDNTWLYSELPLNWGTHMYWGGGQAVSNYWNGDLGQGDYIHQLSVYTPNNSGSGQGGHGHNGSDNFCVQYGYHDNSGYSMENLPFFRFGDGGERVIQGMWINNTTYFVNCVKSGNGLTNAIGDNEWVKIEATGYRSDGTESGKAKTYLALGKRFLVTDWTYFDMTGLDSANKVEFNIVGNTDNGYGFSLPAYFCFDDVQVRMPVTNNMAKVQAKESTKDERMLSIRKENSNALPSISTYWSEGEIPEGIEIEYSQSHDGAQALKLSDKGDEYTLTIKGMPQGALITKIIGHLWCDVETKSKINIHIGANEIVEYKYGSWLLFDDEYPDRNWYSSPTKIEMPIADNANTKCTDDITIYQLCVDGSQAGSTGFDIYYTMPTSTGISEITNEKTASDAIYTLQGVRISNPVKGQIYIKNGKKFIMK